MGVYDKKELVVWDERKDTQMVSICNDIRVLSIKRLGSTCNFIIKSERDKLGVVTIKDIQKPEQISIRHLNFVKGSKYTESMHLQVFITQTHVMVATTTYEIVMGNLKERIQLMKVDFV